MTNKDGRYRAPMNDETYRIIWLRLSKGDFGQDIAADLGINTGRVSEVKNGTRGSHITGLRKAG